MGIYHQHALWLNLCLLSWACNQQRNYYSPHILQCKRNSRI